MELCDHHTVQRYNISMTRKGNLEPAGDPSSFAPGLPPLAAPSLRSLRVLHNQSHVVRCLSCLLSPSGVPELLCVGAAVPVAETCIVCFSANRRLGVRDAAAVGIHMQMSAWTCAFISPGTCEWGGCRVRWQLVSPYSSCRAGSTVGVRVLTLARPHCPPWPVD